MGAGREIGLGAVVQADGSDDRFMVVGLVDGEVCLLDLEKIPRVSAKMRRDAFEVVFREVEAADRAVTL